MGKPGVPVVTQLSVAKGYTVGDPNKRPKTQTTTLSPVVGGIPRAQLPVLCGVDAQSGSVVYSSGVGTFSFLIPLPNLPAPFVVGPSDTAQFLVALSSIAMPAGDAVVEVTLTPQALQGTNPVVTGPGGVLRQGATYTGWQVLVSGSALNATSGGMTVGVLAWLYDSPLVQQ